MDSIWILLHTIGAVSHVGEAEYFRRDPKRYGIDIEEDDKWGTKDKNIDPLSLTPSPGDYLRLN